MKNKTEGKRGFTLFEMTIAMTVTIILMSTIFSLTVSVLRERERAAEDYAVSTELLLVRNGLGLWYNEFSGYRSGESEYLFEKDDENGGVKVISKTDGAEISYILFDSAACSLKSSVFPSDIVFEKVTGVSFTVFDGKVVRADVVYKGSLQPTVIILSGMVISDEG